MAHKRMVSRAYHVSLFTALTAPCGMIFIPCRPDKYASPVNIKRGVKLFALTFAKLPSEAVPHVRSKRCNMTFGAST